MSVRTNKGGFRVDDCRALQPLVRETLYRISAICSHGDDADSERRMLRLTRVFSHWITAVAESAFESDPEAEAMAALDADLARILAERSEGDAG